MEFKKELLETQAHDQRVKKCRAPNFVFIACKGENRDQKTESFHLNSIVCVQVLDTIQTLAGNDHPTHFRVSLRAQNERYI